MHVHIGSKHAEHEESMWSAAGLCLMLQDEMEILTSIETHEYVE